MRGERDDMDRMFEAFDEAPGGDPTVANEGTEPVSDGEVELAVAHVLRRLDRDPAAPVDDHLRGAVTGGPAFSRSRYLWAGLAAGLVLGMALGVSILAWIMQPQAPRPVVEGAQPEVVPTTLVAEPNPPEEAPTPEPAAPPQADPVRPTPPAVAQVEESVAPGAPILEDPMAVVEAPPVEEPAAEPIGAEPIGPGEAAVDVGLWAHGTTEMRVERQAAHLASGMLTFVRNEETRPVVDEVRWERLPLVARPVGTVFVSGACDDLAVVGVRKGRVDLFHRDGTLIDSLFAGDIVMAAPDKASPGGIWTYNGTWIAVEELATVLPESALPSSEALGALLLQIRIALLPKPVLQSLQELENSVP